MEDMSPVHAGKGEVGERVEVHSLGKSINHPEDGGIPVQGGETESIAMCDQGCRGVEG